MKKPRDYDDDNYLEDEESRMELGLTAFGYRLNKGKAFREYEKYKEYLKEQRLRDLEFKKKYPDHNGK